MTDLAGLLVAHAAMFCFALGQGKHAALLLASRPGDRAQRAAQASGWALLALTCAIAVRGYDMGIGLVTFFAWTCFAAWSIAAVISFRRERRSAGSKASRNLLER